MQDYIFKKKRLINKRVSIQSQQLKMRDHLSQCKFNRVAHFASQLFDVLQHWLQILMGVCYLRVIFGHIVLLQLLCLHQQRWKEKEKQTTVICVVKIRMNNNSNNNFLSII